MMLFIVVLPQVAQAKPIAIAEAASAVSASEATLRAWVYMDEAGTYQFEYGTTTSYGSEIPVPAKAIGAGGTTLRQRPEGLSPNTTYHYRLVATNAKGAGQSEDKTFKTSESGLAQHWYTNPLTANPAKITEGTQTPFATQATTNFVLKWTQDAIQFEVSCSTLTMSESTIENPYGKGAGIGAGRLRLGSCVAVTPKTCVMTPNFIEWPVLLSTTEIGGRPAVQVAGNMVEFQVWMEKGSCGYPEATFSGYGYGMLHGSKSTLEFTAANSHLVGQSFPATLTGSAKIETATGQPLLLAP
ncbi:MAG TPA: fibronectin type III domain-containing protein [Solirubrobacterales bacterium]